MSDQNLAIFEDEPVEPEAPEVEAQEPAPEPEAPPEEEQEVPVEADGEGEPEAAPPAADPEPEKVMAPIQAVLDERDKRQKLEREAEKARADAARYQAQLQQIQAAQQQPAPDWELEPAQAAQMQQQTFIDQMRAQTLATSEFLAKREFGDEAVSEMRSFFDQNPQLSQQFATHPSPYHAAMEFYQKQQFLNEVGTDPDAWREAERNRIKEEIKAEMQAAQPKPTPTPPPSLSKAPAGGKLDAIAVDAPPQLNGLFNG